MLAFNCTHVTVCSVTKNQESQKDTEGREGQDETVSSKDTGSRNAGSHGVDVEQIPVKPRRVPRRKEKLESVDEDFNNPEPLAESSGEFSISSSGGEMEESGELHEMIAPEIEGGVTLAQELLNTKPDYLANTGMLHTYWYFISIVLISTASCMHG